MKMTFFPLLLFVVALLPAQVPAAEKYYKWVDEEGVTHYGTEKPNGEDVKEIRVYSQPSSSQGREMQELNERRQAREQAREQEEQAQDEQERAEENPEEVSEEYCEQHRENLKTLMDKPIVRRENPETGEMEVMDQEEREQMIEKTKKELEKCN